MSTVTLFCTPGRHAGPTVAYPAQRTDLPDGWENVQASRIGGRWQLNAGSQASIITCPEHLEQLRRELHESEREDQLVDHETRAKRVDALIEQLGESIHTAFRQAGDSTEATVIWYMIDKMNTREWTAIVRHVAESTLDFCLEAHNE